MSSATTYEEPTGHIVTSNSHSGRHLSWGAILAGLATALSLEVLFVFLGAALGFAVFSPLTDPNPAANFSAGAAVIEGVSAVVSLWIGGWVAGRLSPIGVKTTGWLHGFVVWCGATILGVLLVATGAGSAFSGLSKIVGGGLTVAGKPLAAAAGRATDAAKDALQQSKSAIASFVDEASANPGPNATPATAIRNKREISMALGRLFDPSQRANTDANKAASSKILVDDMGMSQADADKEINDWSSSYERLQSEITDAKNQAEAKAREEANEASKDLAIASACAFLAFLLGAAAATTGGSHGVRSARLHEADTRVA